MNTSPKYLTKEQIDHFNTEGYLIIKDFLTEEQVENFKAGCKKRLPGDSANHEMFEHITLSQEVGDIMHDLLGDEVLYPGLSFMRTNDFPKPFGSRTLHTDAAYEPGNFDEPYPIINSGFYLQDHTTVSGGLKIIPRSHTRECINIRTIAQGFKKMLRYLLKGDFRRAFYTFDLTPSINIKNGARDFLIWNARLHHAGYAVRLKLFPNISIHPVFENWIPTWMKRPSPNEREVILTIYAKPSEIFEKYLEIQIRKAHRKEFFLASNLESPEILEIANKAGITIRNDGYHYAKDPTNEFSVRTHKGKVSGGQ